MSRRRVALAAAAAGAGPRAGALVAGTLAAVALVVGAAAALAAAPPPTPPAVIETPPPPDEKPLDARTFAQGLEAVRQGRRDEAFRVLKRLAADFPDSPYAPQALFKMGDMLYPVGSWQQVGSAAPATIRDAGDLFLAVTQKYRASREAPRALVRLGYLGLEPSNPKVDLDGACGKFASAAQIYPDSDAADDAYFGSGMCETLRGRPARAADYFARLLDESPTSPLAPEALYRHGMVMSRLDQPAEAMLALQQVRSRYPDSPFAARALERISLLHRLRTAPPLLPAAALTATEGRPIYRLDDTYGGDAGRAPVAATVAGLGGGATTAQTSGALQGFRGASDIAIDAQGLAVVASPRTPGVFRLDARGRVRERIDHPGPEYVAVGDGLAVFISGRDQIALNARNWSGADLKDGAGRPVRGYGPVAVDQAGRVHLLDSKDGAVLVFDRNRRLTASLRPDLKDGRFVDLARSEDGTVYVLEERSKTVLELNQGRVARRINLSTLGAVEPVALAVDGIGDLFVLDGKSGWVYVADPEGKRLVVIRPPKAALSRMGDPSTVTVDGLGRVYLAGRKNATVVRFR